MDRLRRFSLASLAFSAVLAACMAGEGGTADTSAPAPAPDAAVTTNATRPDAGLPTDVDRGEGYVHARGCVRCHQSSDPADGILSGSTEPRPGTLAYPKNLTPDSETGIGDWTDRLILRAIREGVDDDASPLCSTMPRYVDMDDDEGAAIVAYLRALPPVHHAIPESECGQGRGVADGGTAEERDAADDAANAADAADAADAMSAIDAASCVGLAAPGTKASCHACGTRPCQPNGCYGGYVCDTRTSTCHPLPIGCTAT
jgi:Cytochrome c